MQEVPSVRGDGVNTSFRHCHGEAEVSIMEAHAATPARALMELASGLMGFEKVEPDFTGGMVVYGVNIYYDGQEELFFATASIGWTG